jgi:hypothetical protein
MFPFWADVPLTAWMQMTALLAGMAAWLASFMMTQSPRC